ncbi:MAG: histidine kinase [Eubacteriales bacterium]|nr:histidine kinase [Eubacteriales bacterium]MDD4683217.1 histidine kinase [Eubacteriales bacterium]
MNNLFGKIKRFIDSISGKITVIMIVAILPLNILVITSTYKSIDVIQNQALTSLENTANQYMQQLDNRIFTSDYYLYDLSNTDEFFISLKSQQGDSRYYLSQTNVAQKLRTNAEHSQSSDGYYFFAKSLDDFSLIMPNPVSANSTVSNNQIRQEITNYLIGADYDNMKLWNRVEIRYGDWLVQVMSDGDFYFGSLISLDKLSMQIREAIDQKNLKIETSVGLPVIQDKQTLQVVSSSLRTDLHLMLSVPRNDVIKSLPIIQWVGIFLAFAYLLVVPFLLIFLNKNLIKPLNMIRDALVRLKKGEKDYRIGATDAAEEFRTINQSFNDMADNINNLKIENYEKDMARQKMELRNLQLQIRPHFLLNMFKLVYSLAQIQEYQSIQRLALYLSNYFRYIFRSGKDLDDFGNELKLIQEYLDVSAIRYPGKFTVEYDIDDRVKQIVVPPLLVHNFVENIMNHALEVDRVVKIMLAGKIIEDHVIFSISDDGRGMKPEIAERINQQNFRSNTGTRVHVGIYNSYQRLRHFYGKDSILKVESNTGEGTKFTISFPLE